jgi:S-adenosyl-L-methionine hydrolase (adenosine-forming)
VGAPVITFLTDYGLTDPFVGVCHAVIAGLSAEVRVIDLTHGVPRGDVRAGALILSGALGFLPVGVHLAVVDPGVGSSRRAVALRTDDGRRFVGPDNGLLWPAAERAGGVVEAVDIGRSPFALQPVSATFHGRDIFAPVAARLADGAELGEAGEAIDPDGVVRLELPRPVVEDGALLAHALYADRFGNVALDASVGALELRPGQRVAVSVRGEAWPAVYGRTFADVAAGELVVYEDSDRRLALVVN